MSSVDHTSRAHALLSASGADRWMACTPSARLEEKFQESKQSVYAEEGTLAHEFGDLNLRFKSGQITNKVLLLELSKLRKNPLWTLDMEVEVAKYTDYVLELFSEAKSRTKDAVILIEERLDFSHLVENGFGTGDANIIADGILDVVDLKFGKGIQVDATENPQLKLYGSGALRKFELHYDIHTIRLHIVQPRLNHISVFQVSVEDLLDWGENQVKPKALLAYSGKGEQVAGDHCKWCKVKPMCKALASKNIELAKHEFADPHKLTDQEIIEVFKQIPMLTDWANSVSSYILDTALKGKQWEGYKLVEGRSVRKWTDEQAVLNSLNDYPKEEITSTKLNGITSIEKLLGKDKFLDILGEYVVKPQGAPTLVEEADKRPALGSVMQAKSDFKD